ncbi:MAG: glucose-6-phosphate isomerase, partial [Nitrospirae bacterium]
MLNLNIAYVMEELIGDAGLSEKEIEQFKETLQNAYQELHQRRWQELAFLDLPEQNVEPVIKIAEEIRLNAESFLVLGIGGSALGPRAILEALSPHHNLHKSPRIFIYDNVDPITLNSIMSVVDLKKTYINVITKSGSTAET